jgi:predicted ester cyclase
MMKTLTSVALATGLIALAGCSKKKEEGTVQKPMEGPVAPATPPPAAAPTPLTGTALADKYKGCIAQISDGKLDEFQKDCLDPSFTTHDISDPTPHSGAELVSWFKQMRAGMPDMKMQPQLVMVSGRNLLAVELLTGTNSAPLKDPSGKEMPATNKKVGMLLFHKLTLNDANLATEEWAYMDPTTMMGQLGELPPGAPPVRPAMDKGLEGAPIVVVTADDAKEKTNLENAKKGIDAINAGKLADAMALMTADVVESDQSADKDRKGAKEIEAGMKMWFGAFKDAKISIDSAYAAGDYVVHLGKFSGTNDKDMGKMKKTGKTVALDYAEIFLVKDGKAAQIWRFHSGMQLATQMGLMPAPAAGSAAPAAGSAAPATPPAPPAPPAGSAAPAAGSAATK